VRHAKTTVYRRWRSKDELALAVLIDMVEHVASVPDLGDTRAELTAFVDRAVKVLRSTLMGRVMQGLVSHLAANPELARAFREHVVAVRVAEIRRLVEKGIARGTAARRRLRARRARGRGSLAGPSPRPTKRRL
jgi:AcrR family transcriptional regulator